MRIEKADTSRRAPQALLLHIRKNYESIPQFAEKHGLDRIKVQKAINGSIARIDGDFAFAIEKATKTSVPAAWWVLANQVAA